MKDSENILSKRKSKPISILILFFILCSNVFASVPSSPFNLQIVDCDIEICSDPVLIPYEDSPFGIWDTKTGWGISEPDFSSMKDIDVHWEAVPVPPLNPNKWEEWKLHYNLYIDSGINPVPMIKLTTKIGIAGIDLAPKVYYDRLHEAVSYFSDIKYWMFSVESDVLYNRGYITPEEYALYMRLSYKALNDVRPSAELVVAGTADNTVGYQDGGFYDLVFAELDYMETIEKNPSSYDWNINSYNLSEEDFQALFAPDNYDTYMEMHHISDFDIKFPSTHYRTGAKQLVEAINAFFSKYGYENVPIWNTQAGTYTGQPDKPFSNYPFQTEADQANDLVRKYIYSIALGIDKVFWTTTYEFLWNDDPYEYFSNVGLIHNGLGDTDPGHGIKKLAYYSYKLMVDKLEGSDWDNIETVIDGANHLYVYALTKKDSNDVVWVAWWDYFQDSAGSRSIPLSTLGISGSAHITEAIPAFYDGLEIVTEGHAYSDPGFFNSYTASGEVVMGNVPLFIEQN